MGEWDSLKGLGLFGGLSPLCSALLSALVQNPYFSLSPYFFIYMLGGAITYFISLNSFNEAKPGFIKNLWNLAGVATAGYVLVYWAKYYSGRLSIVVEVCLLIIVVIYLIWFLYPKLVENYKQSVRYLFIVALLFSVFFSALAILPIEKPNLIVSPEHSYVSFIMFDQHTLEKLREAQNKEINVSINSTLGNAYNIQLTAESDDKNNLTAYIDGIKKGPKEIPSIYRGNGESVVLRLEASPEIQGNKYNESFYNVSLNYTYQDYLGKTYEGSDRIRVSVYTGMTNKSNMPGFGVVITIIMLVILALRRRLK